MEGKAIGILTEDFRLYHDIIRAMKELDLPFHSLSFSEDIPGDVGVIITTRAELPRIDFDKIVTADLGIKLAIHLAQKIISGREMFGSLIIGIDPGRKPGVAVVGDGTVLHTAQASDPEDVLGIVEIAVLLYQAEHVKVRIGHGSPTERNRIINAVSALRLDVEIVDEKRTTNKRSSTADIDAAIEIAYAQGYRAQRTYDVRPTPGEIRDIQRRSRIESGGKLTISRELAKRVATGKITIGKAVRLQRGTGKKEEKTGGDDAACGDDGD